MPYQYHGLNAPVWFGSVQNRMMYGLVDTEISSIQNTFTGYPWVYRTQTDQQYAMTSVRPANLTLVGQMICKLGITTGRSCGEITNTNAAPGYVPYATGFIRADACVDFGDSGGSVISGPEAVGIVSGKYYTFSEYENCDTTPQSSVVFGHVGWALWAMNSSLLIAP